MILANGQQPKIIFDLLAGNQLGTYFYSPEEEKI